MGSYKAQGGLSKANIIAIDEAVNQWARGNYSNKEFKVKILSLGAKVGNKRIGKNDSTDDIIIDFPDGTSQVGFNKGGVVHTDYRKKGLFK